MDSITHNPEVTPTDPDLFKLRMARRGDGKILAMLYLQYVGLPPGIERAKVAEIGVAIGADPHSAPTEHILQTKVLPDVTAAQEWFAKARVEQPWIKRN